MNATVTFDPVDSGPAQGTLNVLFQEVKLRPECGTRSVRVEPERGRSISSSNTNLGGVDVGTSADVLGITTITNIGSDDLSITDLTLSAEGFGQFHVGGLPAGVGPASPLVLAELVRAGHDLRANVWSTASRFRSSRMIPIHQTTVESYVGTGLTSDGVEHGSDHIVFETPRRRGGAFDQRRAFAHQQDLHVIGGKGGVEPRLVRGDGARHDRDRGGRAGFRRQLWTTVRTRRALGLSLSSAPQVQGFLMFNSKLHIARGVIATPVEAERQHVEKAIGLAGDIPAGATLGILTANIGFRIGGRDLWRRSRRVQAGNVGRRLAFVGVQARLDRPAASNGLRGRTAGPRAGRRLP